MKAPWILIFIGVLLTGPAVLCPAMEQATYPPGFSQAELDQMLAPIALYPDVLLSQVLTAATHPLDVVEASRWLDSNPDLEGEDAVLAAGEMPWDASVQTLTAFPDVLERMDDNLSWTRRLGEAFLAQEEQVMETIQALRGRALAEGSLDTLDHLDVEQTAESIVIEPAEPEIIYVPYYSTRIVYGSWWWPHYPPICWDPPYHYPYPRYSSVGFYWSSGFRLSTHFHWSSCDWRQRRVVHRPPPPRPYYKDYHKAGHRTDGQYKPAPAHREREPDYQRHDRPDYTHRPDYKKQDRPDYKRSDRPDKRVASAPPPRDRERVKEVPKSRGKTQPGQLEARTRSDRGTPRVAVQAPKAQPQPAPAVKTTQPSREKQLQASRPRPTRHIQQERSLAKSRPRGRPAIGERP